MELLSYKQTTESNYLNSLTEMAEKHRLEVEHAQAAHALELQRMHKEHSDELERLQARYGDKENKMRSEYESHILGLRSEKNAEEKSHSQLQEDLKRERTRLIT